MTIRVILIKSLFLIFCHFFKVFKCDEPLKVWLFTNARDELHIEEWAAHHFLLGFDKITIFDHMSSYPLINRISNITKFNNKLEIMNYNVKTYGGMKVDLMTKAVNITRSSVNKIDWMLYLDCDEFLILKNYSSVHSFLNDYKNSDSIGVNWLIFGSNHLIEEPKGLYQ